MTTKIGLTTAQLQLVEVCDSLKDSLHTRSVVAGRCAATAAGLALAAALSEVNKGRRAEKTAAAIRQYEGITAVVVNAAEGRVELRIEPRVFGLVKLPTERTQGNPDPRDLAIVVADLLR